jgi:hypothetical protein
MLDHDFQNFDGDLAYLLAEIADWIIEHKPIHPVIMIIEQDSKYLHYRLYCENYN